MLETPIGGNMRAMPLALTDNQLRAVMDAAANVAVEKRDLFLQRVGAALKLCGRCTDGDVSAAVTMALQGLVHEPA